MDSVKFRFHEYRRSPKKIFLVLIKVRIAHAGSSFSKVDDLSTLAFTFATNLVDINANFARVRRKVYASRGGQSNEVAGAGITGLEKSDSATPSENDSLYLSHI